MALLFAALFIVMNGFFVAAEFALVKVRATQLVSRIRRGESSAIMAQTIISRLDRYLSVTQFGITLASLGLGWVGEPAVARVLEPLALRIAPPTAARAAEIVTVVIAFTLLTFAHVLFGELVPKLVAIQRTEQTALIAAHPLRIVYLTFKPLLWVLERASGIVLRMMGLSPDAASEGTLSEEEILGILLANTSRAPGGKERGELLERVLRFAERTARHAMVPRVDVVTLPLSTTGEAALQKLREQGFSRIIVTKERALDDVAGYLYSKDFLVSAEARVAPDLSRLVREVLYVPETRGLLDVVRDMQRRSVPIAVVVDEYGGTSGIVTMEDLLEEIVGEIRDELDEEPARIVKVDDATWDVDARTSVEEVSRAIGVMLEEGAEPVGSVVVAKLERVPRAGDRTELGPGVTAEVTSMSRRRVTRLRVQVSKAA